MANALADELPHFTFPEEPLGLPAAEGFGYFQGGPGAAVGSAGRFKIQAKLGYGTTSSVWLAQDNVTKNHVAVKILTGCATRYNHEEKLEELAVFRRLDAAPVEPYDHCAQLFDVQQAIGDGFIPPKTAKRILRHLLLGIARLHEHGIVHTDIKPDNIMVVLGDHWTNEAIDTWPLPPPSLDALASCNFKLADFSNAQFVDDQTTDDITPLGLRPPEVILGGEWNQSVDIWTFGCLVCVHAADRRPLFKPMVSSKFDMTEVDVLLYQMVLFCGEPFTQEFLQRCPRSADYFNPDGSLKKSLTAPLKPFKQCILHTGCVLSPEDMEGMTDLMTKCLRLDPTRRATAQELLAHPWWEL
ncbi:kinase-like domain-containing protein [Infundibulicybe gibba]|nr:kinase-like domain-containing protein [Infundibulicybe gibba]